MGFITNQWHACGRARGGVSGPAIFLVLFLLTLNTFAQPWGERRRDQFGQAFSYYVYPIAGDVPGLGEASGLGASVLNMFDTDLDFSGFKLQGDFDVAGYTLLNYHLIKNRLIFDAGYFHYDVAPVTYKRGMNSDASDYILPKVRGRFFQSQITLSFWQRQLETYLRILGGRQRLLEVLDRDGRPFAAVDTRNRRVNKYALGLTLDRTDDRVDPRKGYRFEASVAAMPQNQAFRSEYLVADYNFTAYFPMRKQDTLVFNLFKSDAHVTRQAKVDFAALQQQNGLGCENLAPGPEQDQCHGAELRFINQQLAENRHGTATPIGGTQRLRSYDNGRFFAGHALSYGMEYRLNLTNEYTPFNIYVARGIRTGLQLAFFIEQGAVAEHEGDLLDARKTSYGAGFRLLLSGVVIRFDYATGKDGSEPILFLDYAWSMFSVDRN